MNKFTKAIAATMLMMMALVFIGCVETNGTKTIGFSDDFKVPEGAVAGVFTINEEGNRVCFSKGNLQYNPHSNVWRFAEKQYDLLVTEREMTFTNPYDPHGFERVAKVTSKYTSDYDGWIDLFGWGTSGWNSGANAVLPYDTCGSYLDYLNNSLTNEYANADWGVYNPISNAGNDAGKWRVLTKDEWNYICNERRTNSGIRFVKAKVNKVKGVVLIPDNWKKDKFKFNKCNKSNSSFDTNVIDYYSWLSLESSGCVFLPAAGFRQKDMIKCIGYLGAYWSSTIDNDTRDRTHPAYCASFVESEFTPINRFFRPEGLSVRLVSPIE